MSEPRKCPRCSSVMIAGPRGGAAQNYYCTNRPACGLGFNLTLWNGQVLMCQPIGEIDAERFEMYAKQPTKTG